MIEIKIKKLIPAFTGTSLKVLEIIKSNFPIVFYQNWRLNPPTGKNPQ